jgi:Fur family ferric uptake transcriptional regulator
MDRDEEIRQAGRILTEYLRVNGLRKTQERSALLDAIYMYDGYFTPDLLSYDMSEKWNFRVCRATVYNNLALFEDAGLVRKVWLNGEPKYQKIWNNNYGIHLICSGCGSVTDCNDEKVRRQIEEMRKRRFIMSGYSLYIYGHCVKCAAALRRKQRKMEKIYNNKKDDKRKI